MMKNLDYSGLIGLNAVVQKEIERSDTAAHYGEGDFPNLLATPAYVALLIKASTEVVNGKLEDNLTSVGKAMSFVHHQPTQVGLMVSVKATLERTQGRTLFFRIEAYDEIGPIGNGYHERLVVNRDALEHRVKERMSGIAWHGK